MLLLNWRYGQTQSERLAANLLYVAKNMGASIPSPRLEGSTTRKIFVYKKGETDWAANTGASSTPE